MRRTLRIAGALLLTGLAGCGVSDPYNDPEEKRVASAEQRAAELRNDAEDDGGPTAATAAPEPTAFSGAATTPEETLRRAGLLSGTWTSGEIGEQFERLAALSVGIARDEFLRAADQSRQDRQQTDAGLESEATIEALVVRGSGDRRRGLVVTKERLAGDARLAEGAPAYRVTLAELERRGDRWVIASWSPQP